MELPSVYIELLKVGGPVFALASLVVYLSHKRQQDLLKMLSNHLVHTEAELVRGNGIMSHLAKSLDRLVDRIDKLFLDSLKS